MKGGLTTRRMRLIWGGLLAVGLVVEGVALFRPQADDTLSELADDTTEAWPLLPLAVGVVAGHWFHKVGRSALFLGGFGLGAALWPVGGKHE